MKTTMVVESLPSEQAITVKRISAMMHGLQRITARLRIRVSIYRERITNPEVERKSTEPPDYSRFPWFEQ